MAIRLFSRFFGNSVSTASGVAIGAAINPTLNPLTQDLANRTWALHPDVPPDAYALAEGVAQGQVDEGQAREWASQTGFGEPQMSALIDIANIGPGEANAYDWLHRGIIDEAGFRRALKRLGLEDEWIDDAWRARVVLLSVSELANAVVQGHMSMDAATAEAAELGYSAARFSVLVENTGLPPGPETGLDWLRRGVLNEAEFGTLVREGHTKTKYIEKFLAARNHILSATTYAGLRLRGHITPAESYAGGALTGWDQDAMDKLWLVSGRPATAHQVHIGFARGGRNAATGNDERATFTRAVKESNIRDEWEPIMWAQRYTYPSAFVLRALTQSGDLTAAETDEILRFSGWEPTLAQKVSAKWAGGTTAATSPYVTKAQTHLWTTTHRSYVAEESDAAAAGAALTALGVPAAAQPDVIALWDHERSLIRSQLTPAQVKKAYRGAILNRETGLTYTRDDALGELIQRGYSLTEANEFLDL